MFPQNFTNWVFYILLAILLGAIGSGLWETVFKRIYVLIGRLLLTVVTFGLSSARDNIYKDMATRPTYKPALFLVFLVALAFSVFAGASTSKYQSIYLEDPKYVDIQFVSKIKNMSPEEINREREKLKVEEFNVKKNVTVQVMRR